MKKISLEELKTGDVVLVSSHSFLAEEIQKFQDYKGNHAIIIYKNFGTIWASEAVRTGVGFNDFVEHYYKKYQDNEIDLFVFRYPEFSEKVNFKELSKFLLDHTTDSYNIPDLLIWQLIKFISKNFMFFIAKFLKKFKFIFPKINNISDKIIHKFYRGIWIGKKEYDSFICGQWVMYIYYNFLDMFENTWEDGAPVDLANCIDFIKLKLKK